MSGEVRVRRVSWWAAAALVVAVWVYAASMYVVTIRKIDALNAGLAQTVRILKEVANAD